jgi:WD40 repeat protein
MVVHVQCSNPACNKEYNVGESQLGRTAVCKQCGHKFTLSASLADTSRSQRRFAAGTAQPTAAPAGASQQVGRFQIRWDTTNGQELSTLHGHSDAICSLTFSIDGKRLASGSADKTVKIWNMTNGKEELTLSGHSSAVTCVVFSPDGKRIASGSSDNTMRIWDAEKGQQLLAFRGHSR